jgi:hypothetical protein
VPLDASSGTEGKPGVSDFLTVQSFANFTAMTGAITAGWHSLQTVIPAASTLWVPYGAAFAWGIISLLMSLDGLKKNTDGSRLEAGTVGQAIFVALFNSLVLAGAVVGTAVVSAQTP